MRIATGCIGHETNTFTPVPTTLDDFKQFAYHTGDDLISTFAGTGTMTGGYIQRCAELEIELVPLLWTFATPAGVIEQQAYESLKAEFLDHLRQAGEIDGVLLDLHGAMVTEEHEDAEGDLIGAVRQIVGALPIVTTLDLHGNITTEMVKQSDVIIGYDTYPHTDMYERGLEAAKVIYDIVRGNLRPTMSYRQIPLITGPPAQCTMKPLMAGAIKRLHALEERPAVVTATLSMGFPFADIRDAGTSVLVVTNDDQHLAEQCAAEYARYIWDMREKFGIDHIPIEEALERANSTDGGPFVLAEGADNPGGGGPCDGTFILRALIETDAQDAVVAVIADPQSVGQAIQAGVGNHVDLNVGGKTIPLHGEPVALRGYVKGIFDGRVVFKGEMARGKVAEMGRTVVLQVGGVEIILTEERLQPFDAEVIRSVGIEPRERKLIALKSAVHFRAAFTPIAHEIIEVDTPGVHSPDLFTYDYKKLRRPMYPLDEDTQYS
jgi:microcystin degradation protein MlrC